MHVCVPAHSESIALQSEVHEGTLVYSLTDRIHMRWTERMHTFQRACVHTRAHCVPRTFSSCMCSHAEFLKLQQCTRFCRCTLNFRGFCNGVNEMCATRGVGSSVMQTTFLQARLPRVRSLTEKQKTWFRGPSDHPAKATMLAGAAHANACLRSHTRVWCF